MASVEPFLHFTRSTGDRSQISVYFRSPYCGPEVPVSRSIDPFLPTFFFFALVSPTFVSPLNRTRFLQSFVHLLVIRGVNDDDFSGTRLAIWEYKSINQPSIPLFGFEFLTLCSCGRPNVALRTTLLDIHSPSQPLSSPVIRSHTLERISDINLIGTSRYDETTDYHLQFSHVSAFPRSSLERPYAVLYTGLCQHGLSPHSPDVVSTKWSTGMILPSL